VIDDYRDLAAAIAELKIRGAPAIGIAGAYAVALGAIKLESKNPDEFRTVLNGIIASIAATRPTARNLFFALERLRQAAAAVGDI
jgi:methylthioribose-1-phosphate isomerase